MMEYNVDFSGAIKHYRVTKGLKQKELGDLIGADQAYLSQVENGKTTPSIKYIQKICEKLEVPFLLMVWHSMSEENIPEDKREAYGFLKPSIDNMIKEFLPL